jgi:hypothetical protein
MGKSVRSRLRRGALVALATFGVAGIAPSACMAVTTYAAVTGNNANACTLASAPCATISEALTKAVGGGGFPRVIVLGPGIFPEAVTVTSTVGAEIVGDGNGFAAISPPAGGIGIDVEVGTASIRIGNLQFLGSSSSAIIGIKVVTASKVDIENVEFHGFATAAIDSEVSTSPYPSMTVSNSVLADGGCFLAHPLGAANLSALIENTHIRNCATIGVMVDASATTSSGSATAILRSSSVEAAQTGLEVKSGSKSGYAMGTLENTIAENVTDGVVATGANSVVYLNNASLINDHTGVINNGGQVNSYGNNNINWNATNNQGTVNHITLQ